MSAVDGFPGWYIDALEANLDIIIGAQRIERESVQDLAERFLDRTVRDRGVKVDELSHDDHAKSLAICLAILVRKLARPDAPS